MDALTSAVRELYEAFPYPSGVPNLRVGFDARYVLSLSASSRPADQPIRVLDAGCGRGLGLIGAAALQPDVEFTGIDLNRVALAEARDEVRRRGLANVRLLEVDVQTLAGLEVPGAGFDVIHSSGVIHHLADPPAALRLLANRLAPHGVLTLMVYGHRPEIERVAAALATTIGGEGSLAERLAAARVLVRELHERFPEDAAWKRALEVDDVEFVDRYLHPCERTYSVDGLFELVALAGLSFLDWTLPEDWVVELESARELKPREAYRLAERIHAPQKLECYLVRPETSRRPPLRLEQLDAAPIAVNPQVVFEIERRGTFGGSRTERVATRLRGGSSVAWGPGPFASAVLVLSETCEPFLGGDLVRLLVERGATHGEARATVLELLAREIVYSPHSVELEPALGTEAHDGATTLLRQRG